MGCRKGPASHMESFLDPLVHRKNMGWFFISGLVDVHLPHRGIKGSNPSPFQGTLCFVGTTGVSPLGASCGLSN